MPELKSKGENIAHKTVKLDNKDRLIVNILNKNGRAKLTDISREIGLSIDAVKDRLDKMLKNKVITINAIPDTTFFDLPLGVHVYIKLQNISDKNLQEFINYIKQHKKAVLAASMIGDYDIFIVFLAKDAVDLSNIKSDIRKRFSTIISNWSETVTAEWYKYEEYSL